MLLLLIPVLTVSAKNNKENALQQGKLTLTNGTVLSGWLSIRISHGEDEVLYKKDVLCGRDEIFIHQGKSILVLEAFV